MRPTRPSGARRESLSSPRAEAHALPRHESRSSVASTPNTITVDRRRTHRPDIRIAAPRSAGAVAPSSWTGARAVPARRPTEARQVRSIADGVAARERSTLRIIATFGLRERSALRSCDGGVRASERTSPVRHHVVRTIRVCRTEARAAIHVGAKRAAMPATSARRGRRDASTYECAMTPRKVRR